MRTYVRRFYKDITIHSLPPTPYNRSFARKKGTERDTIFSSLLQPCMLKFSIEVWEDKPSDYNNLARNDDFCYVLLD